MILELNKMKKEYIVSFNGIWYHFYIRTSIGFCVSEKADFRFLNEKILLKDAFYDFSVSSNEKGIYVVCQDNNGSIVFFMYDGKIWNSKIILESKDKKARFKNLTLTSIGEFINLFYVVNSKDDNVLVHQILNDGNALPKAIDYVSEIDFSVCKHKTTDITVFYKNADNIYGTKTFKWSKKAFEDFESLECGCDLQKAVSFIDGNDNLNIAAFATFDKFTNILYIEKNYFKDEIKIAAIHLVSGNSENLCLSNENGKLTISWCENGLVMSSVYERDKWTVPKKFLRGSGNENILYFIKDGEKSFSSFGYKQNEQIYLYGLNQAVQNPPEKSLKNTTPKHSEFVKTSIYSKDLAAIRKLLSNQQELILELTKKISVLERTDISNSIIENPDDLDKITVKNLANGI